MAVVDPAVRAEILAGYPFPLDRFQLEAVEALDAGHHVVVAAPTGSGKTVVAEYGIELVRRAGRRAFYTAPLKALSNQKFRDLRERHGPGMVGLLTGDNAIDGDAPVVVMTTEVLRNMIYAGRRVDDLGPRRPRRGALPAGHVPRPGVGGGHRPPAAARAARVPVGDGLQHGRAGGVDPDRPRADDAGRRAAPPGAPARSLPRRRPHERPAAPARDVRGRSAQPRGPAPRRVSRSRSQPLRAAAQGQRPAGPVHAGADRDDRPPGAARPAAGDRVHLQPQPVRRGGAHAASPRGCA